MKSILLIPGYLISGMMVILLPAVANHAVAQDDQEISREVINVKKDTVIPGKPKTTERQRSGIRKEFRDTERESSGKKKPSQERDELTIRRLERKPAGDDTLVNKFYFDDSRNGDLKFFKFQGDSILLKGGLDTLINGMVKGGFDTLMNGMHFKFGAADSSGHEGFITMNNGFKMQMPNRFEGHPEVFFDGPGRINSWRAERNNSQLFTYRNTDKDGISSRMTISINEANKEELSALKLKESAKTDLTITDLALYPNFSSGKMSLSFNIASKGSTEIKIYNSDYQTVFTDKAPGFSGNYTKQLSLPKNGVYFIEISQGSARFIRRIVKE